LYSTDTESWPKVSLTRKTNIAFGPKGSGYVARFSNGQDTTTMHTHILARVPMCRSQLYA